MRLRALLPDAWTVERSSSVEAAASAPDELADGAIDVRDGRGVNVTFAVQAKRSVDPRTVSRLSAGLVRLIRDIAGGHIPLLVVAPWVNPRAQELLADEGINFLDLTGNALVRLDNPAVYIRTVGSARNPQPAARGRARVRGPKAGRLLRLLLDVRPPYGVGEIASVTGLAPGYVSRLLDTLDREALVERGARGRVDHSDVSGLLRRWAESYDVLKSNDAATFLAAGGARDALQRISQMPRRPAIAITGSFGAVRLAAVAAPSFLMAYCDEPEALAAALGWLPAEEGSNAALLRPFDPVVWDRTRESAGIRYVSPSQLAVDCLTGNGRMPLEGEALISWLAEDESRWRIDSIAALPRSGTVSET